jgi:eukaryotic-like serine/threonine-protein kinase
MSTPASSRQLRPYGVIDLIGKGGMGKVWRARNTRLSREVAIGFSQAEFTDRFQRQANAVGSLNPTSAPCSTLTLTISSWN